jgi:hypothetical protein
MAFKAKPLIYRGFILLYERYRADPGTGNLRLIINYLSALFCELVQHRCKNSQGEGRANCYTVL